MASYNILMSLLVRLSRCTVNVSFSTRANVVGHFDTASRNSDSSEGTTFGVNTGAVVTCCMMTVVGDTVTGLINEISVEKSGNSRINYAAIFQDLAQCSRFLKVQLDPYISSIHV